MKKQFAGFMAGTLSLVVACSLTPALSYADTPDTGSSPSTPKAGQTTPSQDDSDDATTEKTTAYSKAPKLSYRIKELGKSNKTYTGSKKRTFKAGIGKIAVSLPKSTVKGKKVKGKVSYGLKFAGEKVKKTTKSNKLIGTSSTSKTLRAFRLSLKGTVAKHYTIYYRVKVDKLGWTDWANNGAWVGTEETLRITGIQMKIANIGEKFNESTDVPLFDKPSLSYKLNKLSGGWTSSKKNGKTAGKQSTKAGSTQLSMDVKASLSGDVVYSVLSRDGKWSSYTSGTAGSDSRSRQIQAVKIKLTGELAKKYDVYYRAYSGKHYWLGWAKNGKKAGTKGIKFPLGAIQAKLVLKGTGAPGSTSKPYTKSKITYKGTQLSMYKKAQSYSSPTNWLILLNRGACRVAVFKGQKGSWKMVKYMLCSPGAYSSPTITGTYYVGSKLYSFGEEKGYSCYYATQISGNYLFHSILYYANTRNVMDATLGSHVSHGCVRLAINNAHYIYNNVPGSTKIISYN